MLENIEDFEYRYSLSEGIKYRLLGDLGRSVYFLNRCIEIFPFSDVAYYELSKVYFSAGETEIAIEHANRALGLNPENLWFYYHLGQIYQENESFADAISVYQNAAAIFPDEIEFQYTLAMLFSINEEFNKSIEVYTALEEKYGINPKFSIPKKHVYIELGEFEKAHNVIVELVSRFPYEPGYLGMLAEFYQSMDMYKEALETYKDLFTLDPDNGFAQISIAEFYLRNSQFEEAFIYLDRAVINPSLNYRDKLPVISAIARDPQLINNYPERVENILITFKNEYPDNSIIEAITSEFYLNSGNYHQAVVLLKKLCLENPNNEIFAEQFVSLLNYTGSYQDAIDMSDFLYENFPENILVIYNLGIAHYLEGYSDTAIKIFKKATTLNIESYELESNIYSLIGELYYKAGDYEKSDQAYETAIEINDRNLVALNNYAYYLSLRGERLETARKLSYITIENESDNASFLDTYAWILYKLEDFDGALKYIELAYNNGGNNRYEIVKHYGQILKKLGRCDEAEIYFNKAAIISDNEQVDDNYNE